MSIYDVIVVGLGPAGATASFELRKRGLDVLALDRESFPRYKPCGGCLSKKIEDLIDFDFMEVVETTIKGAVFTFAFKRELTICSDEPVGYMVQRERFDFLLVEKARDTGVKIKEGEEVKILDKKGDYIEIDTPKGSYKCRYLIGADGPFSIVARTFFPELNRNIGIAMEGEAKATPGLLNRFSGIVGIDFGYIPHGYGWIFPKRGTLSIGIAGLKGCVDNIKEYFNGFIGGKDMGGVEFLKLRGWAIPAFFNGNRIVKERVALIGDAGSMVDPFLGEGIYYAIKSAKVLSKALLDMWDKNIEPHELQRSLEREMYDDFRSAQKVSNLVYGYPEVWYDILEKNPSLMEDYYEVLRGRKSYEDFSVVIRKKIKESSWLWLKIVLSLLIYRLKRLL